MAARDDREERDAFVNGSALARTFILTEEDYDNLVFIQRAIAEECGLPVPLNDVLSATVCAVAMDVSEALRFDIGEG